MQRDTRKTGIFLHFRAGVADTLLMGKTSESLAGFAGQVNAAASMLAPAAAETWMVRKVYISEIASALGVTSANRAKFERGMVEANRAGLIEMVRTDLTAGVAAEIVAQSEIKSGMATWNQVVVS